MIDGTCFLLRASSTMRGEQADLCSLMGEERSQTSDIEGALALLVFAEALVGGDEAALAHARTRVQA